jgi:hypothetical protein
MNSTTLFNSFKIVDSAMNEIFRSDANCRISSNSADTVILQKNIIAKIVNRFIKDKNYSSSDIISLTFNTTFDWSSGTLQRWLSQLGPLGQGELIITTAINSNGLIKPSFIKSLGSSSALIIIIVILICLIIIVCIIFYMRRLKKKNSEQPNYNGPIGYDTPSVYT